MFLIRPFLIILSKKRYNIPLFVAILKYKYFFKILYTIVGTCFLFLLLIPIFDNNILRRLSFIFFISFFVVSLLQKSNLIISNHVFRISLVSSFILFFVFNFLLIFTYFDQLLTTQEMINMSV